MKIGLAGLRHEVRSAAGRWQALDQAYSKLITDGGHLDALMAVDGEQQESASHHQVVVDSALISQLNDQEQQAWNERQFLTGKKFIHGDELSSLRLLSSVSTCRKPTTCLMLQMV